MTRAMNPHDAWRHTGRASCDKVRTETGAVPVPVWDIAAMPAQHAGLYETKFCPSPLPAASSARLQAFTTHAADGPHSEAALPKSDEAEQYAAARSSIVNRRRSIIAV